MRLVKIDRPRRIDQFVDYFGEPHRALSGSRLDRGPARNPRGPRLGEKVSGGGMILHALRATV